MSKRYRYIMSGKCSPDDQVSDFRLIASNYLCTNRGDSLIRIEIPDDMELEKYRCDTYSTTSDTRLIRDLNPVVLTHVLRSNWVRHEKLTKYWLEGTLEPHEFWYYTDGLKKFPDEVEEDPKPKEIEKEEQITIVSSETRSGVIWLKDLASRIVRQGSEMSEEEIYKTLWMTYMGGTPYVRYNEI